MVEGGDDRIEHAGAGIAPSRRVQRHRELAVAAPVQGCEGLDERQEIRAGSEPRVEDVLDSGAQPAPAVPEELGEQRLAVAEVVGDTGVGHTDPRGHRPYLDGGDTAVGEQLRRGVQDHPAGLVRGPAHSRGRSRSATLP